MTFPQSHGPRAVKINDQELFKLIRALPSLQAAWNKVWSNQGAGGGDRVSLQQFYPDQAMLLGRLANQLAEGSYFPGPLRFVDIPKRAGGETRRLSIPCVIDRVAQTAVTNHLGPLLDDEFEDTSFAYRPGRSVPQAVSKVSSLISSGLGWVVDADIADFFDQIPHDRLMERLGESLDEGPLTELIRTWLTHAHPGGRGVAQGSPLSPLLANLFLDRLDEAFAEKDARLVRFADDFVILTRSQPGADKALCLVERRLADFGLTLNDEKTQVIDINKGFRFLGHLFVRSMVMKSSPEGGNDAGAETWLRRLANEDDAKREKSAAALAREEDFELKGYSPGHKTLYIMEADRRLSLRNQAFSVEEALGIKSSGGDEREWRELIAIPHQQIDRIDIGPKVTVTEQALRQALASDTPIAYVNGHGETLGWSANVLAPRAGRHLAQARTALDEGARLELARIIVEGRLRNQRAVLRRILSGHNEKPAKVISAIGGISKLLGRQDHSRIKHAKSTEQLLGYEGQAGALWWPAVSALSHADLRFRTRTRQPARDSANICLNYLSWLLHRDISTAVMRAGLHPGFGVLHGVDDRHDACVYDLMEEFRAQFIGGLFIYCSNRRLVRPPMFTRFASGLRISAQGGQALIRAYEQRAANKVMNPLTGKRGTWGQLMLDQAFALARHFEHGETYQPYVMDY